MRSVRLFGITIHNVDMEEALRTVLEDWMAREGEKHFVTTPNADHLVKLQRDAAFREVYAHASLVVPDGMPLVWASRLLGRPLQARVTGADLMHKICERAALEGRSVFLLGGRTGIAARAVDNLKRRLPNLIIAGFYSPPLGFESNERENRTICERVNAAKPDVLFVGFGAPKQEKWLYRHRQDLQFKAALCVGAALDFEAGAVRRAPRWMHGAGMEWLWRLVQEPRRLWRRYLVEDTAFFGLCWREFASRNSAAVKRPIA